MPPPCLPTMGVSHADKAFNRTPSHSSTAPDNKTVNAGETRLVGRNHQRSVSCGALPASSLNTPSDPVELEKLQRKERQRQKQLEFQQKLKQKQSTGSETPSTRSSNDMGENYN